MVCIVLIRQFDFCCRVATLSRQDIKSNHDRQYSVELESYMYYNHHRIIKYVGFKTIYCIINLNITLSFRVFNEFDFLFLSNVLLI